MTDDYSPDATGANRGAPTLSETFNYDWNGRIQYGLDELTGLANGLDNDGRTMRPREVVALFGYQKRGSWLLQGIRKACDVLGVSFTPELDAVGIDDKVKLHLVHTSGVRSAAPREQSSQDPRAGKEEGGTGVRDLVKIANLPSARAGICSVNPQEGLRCAWAVMTTRGFSQLPVMMTSRKVEGVFSWASMSRSLVRGTAVSADDEVKQHMSDEFQVCKASQPLLTAMSLVTDHEFVLVRDEKEEISGIVTTTDLAAFLLEKYEPFSILGEIERTFRIWLGSSLDPASIREVRASGSPLGGPVRVHG